MAQAFAQTTDAPAAVATQAPSTVAIPAPVPVDPYQEMLLQFTPLVAIGLIFYFILFRPQQQKLRREREALSVLRRGDKVVTGGGMIAQVTKVVSDTELEVEIASGVRVRVMRNSITQILSKTEPAGPAEAEPVEAEAVGSTTGRRSGRAAGK